jgi:hypothetical protein
VLWNPSAADAGPGKMKKLEIVSLSVCNLQKKSGELE